MATSQTRLREAAQQVISYCEAIARFSESEEGTTRTFLCDVMHDCHRFLRSWMETLGMTVTIDNVGNLRGAYAGSLADAPYLAIGSHLDTVPNAGAYDGVLGVVMALALIQELHGRKLPFALEVIGFSEEEGIRFAVPFLGSIGWVHGLDNGLLGMEDSAGVSVAQAIERFGLDSSSNAPSCKKDPLGFLEFHIEQGPVLETLDLPLGLVTAIAGQTRASVTFRGQANHAGTTPMRLRRDALACAAAWITSVEQEALTVEGLVATVGAVEAKPGAGNVIPGEVRVTLDVRHAADQARLESVERLFEKASELARSRNLTVEYAVRTNQSTVAMDRNLTAVAERSLAVIGVPPYRMVSGAGHDAMIVSGRIPAAMIFLRSPGGISHHPQESVWLDDVETALQAGLVFLEELGRTLVY